MFTSDEIMQRVKQKPFLPMRIITSAGDHYDVHHPDWSWSAGDWSWSGRQATRIRRIFDRVTQLVDPALASNREICPGPPAECERSGERSGSVHTKNPTPFRRPDTRLTFGSRPSLSVSLAALSTPPSEWVRP